MTSNDSTIVLMPGDFGFGDRHTRMRTLLGSCVAVTLWHPQQRVGGMCHFVLPSRRSGVSQVLDGRYGDEAMELFLRELRARCTRPQEYQVKLFGAANMFRDFRGTCADVDLYSARFCPGCVSVACKNRHAAQREVRKHGFTVAEVDLGGTHGREVEFNIADGKTVIRKMLESA